MTTLLKRDEMKLLAELIAQLPDGYVRDILTEATPFIDCEIRNDNATHAPISGLIHARDEIAAQNKAAKLELAGLQDACLTTRRELNRLSKELEDVKSAIRTLHRNV